MKLKYIGNGSFIVGVPARDLNEQEAEYYGVNRLLGSRLYEPIDPPRSKRKKSQENAKRSDYESEEA